MRAAIVVILLGAVALLSAAGVMAWELSRVGVHQGYAPEQPIAFSHKLHAGDSKIPCQYCHGGARTSRHAGIPALNVCMNCHSMLTKQTVEIEKLKEAVQRQQAIAWVKVHNLPDFVYFSHSQHVTGGVACASCHGAVETMTRVRQEAPLTMGWCLDCHRAHGPDLARQRRAAGSREPADAPFPGMDCGKCHL
jgi:Cytochrome c7 and related cytochrome c/Class III cytochrome C family